MPELKPGEPLWWLARLYKGLRDRRSRLEKYDEYYEGEQKLTFATERFKKVFGDTFEQFSDNWCALVVDAVEERLNIEGFRLGDQPADADAWRIWQANQLDAMSQLAHVEALVKEESYALVWAGDRDNTPAITIEDPLQTIVDYQPGTSRRAAALKVWRDDWEGHTFANVYLPDAIYKYRTATKSRSQWTASTAATGSGWVPREVDGEDWPLPNPLEVVPVVPLQNRPRLLRPAVSEIKYVLPMQDAVNKLIVDMMVASEFTAFRQRWATGLEIPIDPETKEPVEPFESAVDRLWAVEDDKTTFGEFSATDLSNYVAAVEMVVQHVASQTRTPPHYFYLRGEFPSGESIKSAETGLVAKVLRKQRFFGEAWEETIRLALLIANPSRDAGALDAMETVWRDPESRTESEHIDAVMKQKALGIPDEVLWEKVGYSPTEIERIKQILAGQPPDEDEPDVEDLPEPEEVPAA